MVEADHPRTPLAMLPRRFRTYTSACRSCLPATQRMQSQELHAAAAAAQLQCRQSWSRCMKAWLTWHNCWQDLRGRVRRQQAPMNSHNSWSSSRSMSTVEECPALPAAVGSARGRPGSQHQGVVCRAPAGAKGARGPTPDSNLTAQQLCWQSWRSCRRTSCCCKGR